MSAIDGRQRRRLAAALREGASHAEAARAAGISKRSVSNLLRDPAFAALVRGETIVTAGAAMLDVPQREAEAVLPGSWAYFTLDGRVLGSALNPADDAESVVSCEFTDEPERVREIEQALAEGRVPPRNPRLEVEAA